jgi:PAS domain-containing protein
MPPLFWVDIIGLSISIPVTYSLAFSVIVVNPKNPTNLSFGFFVGSIALWTTSGLFLRLTLWLKPVISTASFLPDTIVWVKSASIFIGLTAILALLFTVAFLNRRNRWTDVALAFAFLLFVIFVAIGLSTQGTFIKSVQLDEYGLIRHEKSRLAWVLLAMWGSYIVWSLILFWHERHRNGSFYLALGMLILLLGLIIRVVIFVPFPLVSFSNATCAFIFAYGVISKQIFNPLREQTIKLNKEIEDRKQAQKALKESEKKYRQIYNNIIDVYYEADIDGVITEISPSIEKNSKYKREELIGKSLYDVFADPEKKNELQKAAHERGQGG